MKELIEKLLTDKAARNTITVAMLALSLTTVGHPWDGI
jgi:hypothetical protein